MTSFKAITMSDAAKFNSNSPATGKPLMPELTRREASANSI
jgi:hypothetical protein